MTGASMTAIIGTPGLAVARVMAMRWPEDGWQRDGAGVERHS